MEKFTSRIDQTVKKINALMKQRIITAVLMIYQGIMALLEPNMAAIGMTQGMCITVALAAVGFLIDAYRKKDRKTAALSGLALAAAVFFFFNPDPVAGLMRYVIAFSALAVGIVNLFQATHANKAVALHESMRQKADQAASHSTITENIQHTIQTEVQNRLSDTEKLVSWISRGKYAAWITGILMTIIGILLLIFSGEGNIVITIISAIFMIAVGVFNLVAGIRIWKEKRKAAL